jgi:cytosine deaminase
MIRLPAEWPHSIRLANATIPGAVVASAGGETIRADLVLAGGVIQAIGPAGTGPESTATIDLAGRIVWPCFLDAHTHLDKTQIWGRTPNPDGSFAGALGSVASDRAARWSAEDVIRRMDFGLRAAYAHGTGAIRTHLDSEAAQAAISWGVFREMRQEWRDRVTLQAVSLVGIEALRDADAAESLAGLVKESGGILGAVTYAVPDRPALLDRLFYLAERYDLALDLHVDENDDPDGASLGLIAETVLRRRFSAPVSVGHCCSIALQDEAEIDRVLDRVAEAGMSVITLPSCNLYLQDRRPGRTPRWRGVTLLHEMRARGIRVVIAGDNCRDPFFAYGDHDMAEVFRDAVRILHLDHPFGDWPASVNRWPARLMGLPDPVLVPGAAADLVIFDGRSFNEMLCRPQTARIVLRQGRPIDTTLPDYALLD